WGILLIAAGSGAAVVTLLLTRRLLAWFLGPIFVYETLRLARKGHTFWLRITFALLTLGLLYAAEPHHPTVSKDTLQVMLLRADSRVEMEEVLNAPDQVMRRLEMQRFAEEFSRSFLLALAVAVVLITPLYFGTAVSEEREKRTLDFLLGTRLSSRDIVL